MKVRFYKYHAVGNDFLVLEAAATRIRGASLPRLTRAICHRRTGVGADGVLWLSSSSKADCRVDVYNADGSWAEKSGNGLRIIGLHLARRHRRRREFLIETGSGLDLVRVGRSRRGGYELTTELGRPEFEARKVPVRTRLPYVINGPLSIGPVALPMTCLSVGNPHAVVLVDGFEFDWQVLGAAIENAAVFPNGTNVEFVKILSRTRLRLCEWERGAGATGSSGTGAAAAVVALVMLGLSERRCRVLFDFGALNVVWDARTDLIRLTGPAAYIAEGAFEIA